MQSRQLSQPNQARDGEEVEAVALVPVYLRELGLSWESERVRLFLSRVAEREGRPMPSRYYLPAWAYASLLRQLKEETQCLKRKDQS